MSIGGTPVGNMIIKVDLDSTGVEKSMTGLQRQLRSSNKAMGAQLSAFGRGEKSAAKYGVLIEGLSNRHRIQAQMVQEARRRYDEMVRTYGENSVKAQQASQQLNEQIARYQETGRELDAVTKEFEEFQRVQELQNTGWYKAADSMEEWGGRLKTAGSYMDDTGQKLTRGVTMPLAAVGGIATKVGSDFEAGMSRVGAVSGASAEDMEKLEAKAREMGATTVFSATEASDAMYYMSLAGWDAQESMDGISGVMDLAAASGEDLAQVADIVTDGLTAFQMEAKDSGRMADVLAAASANANTDVSGLGQAFSYVAPVAGALGYTIEDTSKAIGLMSNAGIKSTKAGTALRKMMNSLAKPTESAQKLLDKYGVSLTDSEGNMKSFDKVMKDLRKGLGNLNEEQQAQAAATIFGQEAMSGALAIVNASESDYKKLTKEIKNSEGAAADMADTMQDNLQGSLKELKSMVEDLFIEMYQNLKPTIESVIEGAKDLTQWFSNLSPETQENIVKFGLLAAAMGPVLSITGKLTFGIGGLMQGAGALTKAIGMSKGAGLLGALGNLGPLAIGGVAVAGIAGVAVAVKRLRDDSEELEEVNLDVAESFTDQALELEASANTFDKLSEKAKISNEELAELNDLNIRISESSNPGEIKELQKQYDELAKNSGLSKDELKELFEANANIIEQSPDVEKSISDQGNEFVKSTDAVNEYIQSLYEMSRQELSDELVIAEENKRKILQENKQLNEEINQLNEKSLELRDLEALTEEERLATLTERLQAIAQEKASSETSQERMNELLKEEEIVQAYIKDGLTGGLEAINEQRDALNEKVAKNDEELEKINALNDQMTDIVLKQAGITEEGEKGLAALDESIAKNDEELLKLEQKLEKNGELTEKEKERYETLLETNSKQREARDYLHDELEVYKDINSLVNAKMEGLDEEKQKRIDNLAQVIDLENAEKDIVKAIENKNNKLLEERSELEKNRKEKGANKKEIDKQISSIDEKISKNDHVMASILAELGIWEDIEGIIQLGSDKIDAKNKKVDEGTSKQKNQGSQIDKNNKKTDQGIKKEEQRTKEAGKSVDKKVTAKDHGTVAKIDRAASKSKNKNVNLKAKGVDKVNKQASSPVRKVVNFVGKGLSKLKFWAKGTPPSGHPGGPAVIGEKGSELVQLPSGQSFLSPDSHTLLDLPKGSHVVPHHKTKRLMRSIPKYADGTKGWSDALRDTELARLLAINNQSKDPTIVIKQENKNDSSDDKKTNEMLALLFEQNEHLRKSNELLTALIGKDLDLYKLNKKVDEGLSNLGDRRNAALGIK